MLAAILTLINQLFSWLNINLTIKNKIYIISGWVVWFYLIHLFITYIKIHFYKMSLLLGASIIFLLYFLILNTFYYFKNKNFKWDVSQKISPLIEQNNMNYISTLNSDTILYDSKIYTSEGIILYSDNYELKLNRILNDLKQNKYIEVKENNKWSSGDEYDGVIIPSANIVEKNGKLFVTVGINGFTQNQMELGELTSVANNPVNFISKYYTIKIKEIRVSGGKYFKKGKVTSQNPISIKTYIEFH